MEKKLTYSPDEAIGGGGTAKGHSKPAIARADADLGTQARSISDKWTDTPVITLLWTDSDIFKKAVEQYNKDVQDRRDIGATRPAATLDKETLEEQMDDAISDLKIDISHKFRQSAKAQYPRYGLVHRNGRWELPADQDDLKHAIESILTAVVADGLDAGTYGKAFWTDIKKNYKDALDAAKSADGQVSGKVSDKNTGKAYLRKVIVALRHIIVGNYPDTYPSVLREWGWQKEDF